MCDGVAQGQVDPINGVFDAVAGGSCIELPEKKIQNECRYSHILLYGHYLSGTYTSPEIICLYYFYQDNLQMKILGIIDDISDMPHYYKHVHQDDVIVHLQSSIVMAVGVCEGAHSAMHTQLIIMFSTKE
ncbi:hypothetical protein ACJX0J_010668 [Zea mays]